MFFTVAYSEKYMHFSEQLAESKKSISEYLHYFLESSADSHKDVNALAGDLKNRLLPFSLNGKMIRGSLVVHMHRFLAGKAENDALKAAAALELIHGALLMHDDIMDNDTQRRGHPTIHVQYQDQYARQSTSLVGTSLAICLGDEALFLAMELLASLEDVHAAKVMRFMAPEMVKTGLGQAQDALSSELPTVTKDEILSTYLYKTAGYTFTIPLSIGALLAGKDSQYLAVLKKIGTELGLLFQFRDDYLGIFGDPKKTGKNKISDVAENKKTLIREYMYLKATQSEKKWLDSLFGNQNITDADIADIEVFSRKKGILDLIDQELDGYHRSVFELLPSLELSQEGEQFFTEFTQYLRNRDA